MLNEEIFYMSWQRYDIKEVNDLAHSMCVSFSTVESDMEEIWQAAYYFWDAQKLCNRHGEILSGSSYSNW